MNLFDQDGRLDSDVEDALSELGNVGVGMASITIGRILGVRVELEAPSVIPAGEAGEQSLLSSLGQESIGIWMKFAEPLSGSVLCVLKRGFVYDVVEKMTGQRLEGEALYADELAFSALAEFANMLSAAYMNAVGKYTGMRIFVTPYRLSDGNEWAGKGRRFRRPGYLGRNKVPAAGRRRRAHTRCRAGHYDAGRGCGGDADGSAGAVVSGKTA